MEVEEFEPILVDAGIIIGKTKKLKKKKKKENKTRINFKVYRIFPFHVVFTLMIVEVVIGNKTGAAELTTTAWAAVPYLFLVFLTFRMDLKLFRTGKLGVVFTTRSWSFRYRTSNG